MSTAGGERVVRVCAAAELPPGGRVIRSVGGRSIGVFNVGGAIYALHNRCPHRGAQLCLGPVTGTTVGAQDDRYVYGREGEILRCAWHGWEFEIATGRSLADPRVRARSYRAFVRGDDVCVVM